MNKKVIKTIMVCFLLILLIKFSIAADDEYKPYLHKAAVPEHPKLELYSQYKTNLFPGTATYTYNIEVPKGTNGLTPELSVYYNSQTVKQRPGILGAGWLLTQNLVYRDANSTLNDTSDDIYKLVLNNVPYELVHSNNSFHAKMDSYMKIENLSGGTNLYGSYWSVTLKDGTNYRFGYNADSELTSNSGYDYVLKWSLDQIEDTHNNKIYYSYLEDPFNEDLGTAYLNEISYNNEQKRKINFSYENSSRPDNRLVYEQGNKLNENRRLENISVYANSNLVRKYSFEYAALNSAGSLSSISSIKQYGSDASSLLHQISFEYYNDSQGYTRYNDSFIPERPFADYNHNDAGVRLLDFNNDGFIDIIKGRWAESAKEAFVNNKLGNWTTTTNFIPPMYISVRPGETEVDNGVRFADINNDGLVDILHGVSNASLKKAYLNNGTGWNESSVWKPPIYIVENYMDDGVRLVDFNGDGRVDILQADDDGRKSWLNNGSGWTDVSSAWQSPAYFIGGHKDIGSRIIDLNGDGLPDVIQGSNLGSSIKKAWLNNGSGWSNYSNYAPPVYFTTSSRADNGVRFADINGDGLSDLLEDFNDTSGESKGVWLNNGDGWTAAGNESFAPEYFTENGHNLGRRLADVNGDGFADFIVAYRNDTGDELYTYIKNATSSYLLKRVINEYGGIIEIDYSSSTKYNHTVENKSQLGFNIWVVGNVSQNNSLSGELNSIGNYSYSYARGLYDYNLSAFRGFGFVNETKKEGSIVHYFHQSDALKGKEYKTETYNLSGLLHSVEENNYNYTFDSYYEVFLTDSSSYLYDGSSNPEITNVSYEYDNYSNVISKISYGDVSVSGDEKYEYYSYVYNKDDWIIDKVSKYKLYSDDNSSLVKKTEYAYDGLGYGISPLKGDLTKVKEWNSDGDDVITKFKYDSYGNLIKKTDALGYSTKYIYGLRDTTFTYPDRITNALGHRTDYSYELGTGNLLWEEKNNIKKQYVYDVNGRILKEILPYDSVSLPTKEYTYTFDSVAPEIIKVSLRDSGGSTADTYYYYDGFANLVQLKISIEDDKAVVKNIFYDGLGRVSSEQNPYKETFSSSLSTPNSTINKTYYSYDALDRVIKVINPDNTSKRVEFNKWIITDYNENNNKHSYLLDAYGRIVNVIEYNTIPHAYNYEYIYNTSYEYDSNDNLIKITDDKGNEFKFDYDSLGRKIKLDDPDLGIWHYSYDVNGNLITQNDSKGNEITLSYDALNRIINKTSEHVNTSFSYDSQYDGTLSNVTTKITNLTSENIAYKYTYDDRLRITKEEILLNGSWIETGISYDSMDRIVEKRLPSDDLEYFYNKQGKIKEIMYYLGDSKYNSFGSLTNRSYGSYIINSVFTYSSATNRIKQIKTDNGLQQLDYSYDDVGNVVSINDTVNSRSYHMSYDGLDRLINTTINNDIYQYEYDSIGNIKRIVRGADAKRLIYDNLPHTPSEVIDTDAGSGAYYASDVNSGNKNRTIEFFLVNEKNATYNNINWSIDFADGNTVSSSQQINLSSSLMVLVQHDYTNAGTYNINVSTDEDFNLFKDKFGLDAKSLTLIDSNISLTFLEFIINNEISEKATGGSWSCDNGISSSEPFNISGNDDIFVIIENNYTSPGSKEVICKAASDDGSGNKSTSFKIKGIEIEEYEIFDNKTNKKTVVFNVTNYFHPLTITSKLLSDDNSVEESFDLNTSQSKLITAEINYTTDGSKKINITATSGSIIGEFVNNFILNALEIERYHRFKTKNDTKRFITFSLFNYWNENITVNYNLSDPVVHNATTLRYNQSVMVIIEENYTSQGKKEPNIQTYATDSSENFTSSISDWFNIYIIQLLDLQVLQEIQTSTISEIRARSNTGNRTFSWSFNTGEETITSDEQISLNDSDSAFIFIENDYTLAAIHLLNASINTSSSNQDSKTGVAVIPIP